MMRGADISECSLFTKLPDGVLRPGGLLLTKRLVDYCAFGHDAKVIDIGCGTGITVEYLRDIYGLSAVGVDVSDSLLQQGRERSAGLRLVRAAGEDLPFADHSVNGVLAECSLSVMQDANRVLAEINRILVPGGNLAVTDIYIRNTGSASSTDGLPGEDCVSGVMTEGELIQMFVANGFSTMIWEDQSALLKEFVARFIMEHGSREELWTCIARKNGRRAFHSAKSLGYYLLVTEKRQ